MYKCFAPIKSNAPLALKQLFVRVDKSFSFDSAIIAHDSRNDSKLDDFKKSKNDNEQAKVI